MNGLLPERFSLFLFLPWVQVTYLSPQPRQQPPAGWHLTAGYMYMGNMGGLCRMTAHPHMMSISVSHLTMILTNTWGKDLLTAASQSNLCFTLFFFFLSWWWFIAMKARKEEVNSNPIENSGRAFSCQVLSSHADWGHLRAQRTAQNWTCGWWDFMQRWATRTPGQKFSTRNGD